MASKDLNFKVNGKNIGLTKYQGYARNFELIVDEPEVLGGEDSAANPVEYLLAGYAGCLNVVFGIVAKELNIEILFSDKSFVIELKKGANFFKSAPKLYI